MKSMRSPSASIFFTVRNEVAKVMFLQVSVCPQWGGGGIPACLVGGIPACLVAGLWGGAIPACIAGGIPACLATGLQRGGVCLAEGCPLGGGSLLQGGLLLEGVETPRKQTATVADVMHPTGMHSCYDFITTRPGTWPLAPWIHYCMGLPYWFKDIFACDLNCSVRGRVSSSRTSFGHLRTLIQRCPPPKYYCFHPDTLCK